MVQYFWIMVNNGAQSFKVRSFCDCSAGIIVQHYNGRSSFIKDGERLLPAFVYGPYTVPSVTFSDQTVALTGVVFKQQALPLLFKTYSHEFTDRMVSLEEFSNQSTVQRFLDSADPENWKDRLIHFLVARINLNKNFVFDPVIQSAMDAIHSPNTKLLCLTVDNLVKLSGLSKHQLEKRFLRAIGVPPKYYLRIFRLRKAIKMIEKGNFHNLTELAYSMNYYDQSHFIRDIKALTCATPKELSRFVSQYGRIEHFMLTG